MTDVTAMPKRATPRVGKTMAVAVLMGVAIAVWHCSLDCVGAA